MQASMVLPILYGEDESPYIQQFTWEFKESIDSQQFLRAWQLVLGRHDVFYSRFSLNRQGMVEIRMAERPQMEFNYHDYIDLPRKAQCAELKAFKSEDRSRGFAPPRESLCRFNLFRLSKQRFQLLWTSHHCLFDGRSRLLLIREFIEIYSALNKGKQPELPASHVFAEFQNWMQSHSFESSKKYWGDLLKGFDEPTPLFSGLDLEPPNNTGQSVAKYTTSLSQSFSQKVQRWSKTHGVSINILAQTAWAIFLHKTSGNDLVVFGAPRACRRSSIRSAEKTVGLFVNTIPVAIEFTGSEKVETLVKSVRNQWRADRDHENSPLHLIKETIGFKSNKPLFKSMVGFEKYQLCDLLLAETGKRYQVELEGYTEIPLVIQVHDGPRLSIICTYHSTQFSESGIKQRVSCIEAILRQLIENPSREVKDIQLMSKREIKQSLRASIGKAVPLSGHAVHQRFEEIVINNPQQTALVFENQRFSYEELNTQSNQLARYLEKLGVKTRTRVGLLTERNISMVVSTLAVLKVGGTYVPIDIESPKERLDWQVRDSGITHLLTSSDFKETVNSANLKVIYLDREIRSIANLPSRNLSRKITQDFPAYIMYTSGSTGRPKGVVVPHRGITRLVVDPTYVQLGKDTILLQMAPIAFDASTFEIWGALLNGGTCVLYPKQIPDLFDLKRVLKEQGINTLWLTSSLFNFFIDAEPETFQGVRQLLVGGEALSPEHVQRGYKYLKNTQLINGYGPTENTTFSCCYQIPNPLPTKANIPLGPPIQNSSAYVLDKHLNLLPPGIPGELHVGGLGVALGYLNNKDLSSEKFIEDPFSAGNGHRLYKTGDKAFRSRTGDILFLGRFDDQVKIRGHRIEPGEIKAEFMKSPAIQEAFVKTVTNQRNELELAAYLVAKGGSTASSGEIRNWLEKRVPKYLVPKYIVFLEVLPLTSNGKIDSKALKVPDDDTYDIVTKRDTRVSRTERFLIKQWKQLLGLKSLSLETSFFEVGGHSLKAIQLIYILQAKYHIEVPLCEFEENDTIRALAKWIDRHSKESDRSKTPHFEIRPVAVPRINPLCYRWNDAYFEQISDSSKASSLISRAFIFKGRMSRHRLRKSINIVANQHERLRTKATKVGSRFFEEVMPSVEVELGYSDLSSLGPDKAMHCANRSYEKAYTMQMDCTKLPLIETQLFKLSNRKYFFIFTIHHLVADGASIELLFKQISQTYSELSQGDKPSMQPPRFTTQQYYRAFENWIQGANRKRLEKYWEAESKDLYRYKLPFEKKHYTQANAQYSVMETYRFKSDWSKSIDDFCKKQRVSEYVFLLTVVQIMISRYLDKQLVYVTNHTNTRRTPQESEIIGDLTSSVFIKHRLLATDSFVELARQLKVKVYEVTEYNILGSPRLSSWEPNIDEPGFKASRHFSVMQSPDFSSSLTLPGISVDAVPRRKRTTDTKVCLVLSKLKEDRILEIHYPPKIFLKNGIERMFFNLQWFIRLALNSPELPLNQFPILEDPKSACQQLTKKEKATAILEPITS